MEVFFRKLSFINGSVGKILTVLSLSHKNLSLRYGFICPVKPTQTGILLFILSQDHKK